MIKSPNLLKLLNKDLVFQSSNISNKIKNSKQIQDPLSEHDIFDLQDKFLTPGFHYVKASDIKFGRTIINKFLSLLYCYNEIAVLTAADLPLANHITDIHYTLLKEGYLSSSFFELEDFFIEQFYYDFMWIEVSQELIQTKWFSDFFEKMIHFTLIQNIPVLIFSYLND